MRFASRVFLFAILFATACTPISLSDSQTLNVVASSQIVGDVVRVIAGDLAEVTFLIPPGTDPHAYEPSPQDARMLAEADIVFINGLGLEEALQPLLDEQAGKVVNVSEGVQPLELVEEVEAGEDPHVWMNPLNVKIWTDNIAQALGEADSANALAYSSNTQAYKAEVDELDAWAVEQIGQISEENRVLVTDHESFGYFADRYGFEIVGTLIPSYSTLSETSAGELAELEKAIQDLGVKAIFVGVSLNPSLAQRVAEDTGVLLVPVYTESLGGPDGLAPTYLAMIRFDVESIVAALSDDS